MMKSGPTIWIAILLAALFSGGCVSTLPSNEIGGGRTYKARVNIRLRGFQRNFLVHLPPGYRKGEPLPLVIVLHGAFDTGKGMEKVTGFSDLADRENFIVVYPAGLGLFGLLQHWNAGHCCARAAAINLDDVGFLEAVIEETCARLSIDRRRIYMTGFSNGGMMTYRFAAEKGARLAAIAPLAAVSGGRLNEKMPDWSLPRPAAALPVLTMHGSADERIPFAGKNSPSHGNHAFWSVQRSLDVWIERNGCTADPLVRTERSGRVVITHWKNCSEPSEVYLYELMDWDHRWPGRFFTKNQPAGDPLYGFDAAEIIWSFFKRYQCHTENPE